MAITQEKNIEMLEKLADGNFKIKYPKTRDTQVIGLETAQKILDKIKTVDGAGSGLDADLLDGKQASEFQLIVDASKTATGSYSGTGATKTITVGFTPKFVYIVGTDASNRNSYILLQNANINIWYTTSGHLEADSMLKIVTNGFTVGSNLAGANGSDQSYQWVAFA